MGHTSGSQDSGHAGMSNAWLVFRSLYSYRIQFLTHDLFAGLTLAAIAIPEQMATARLGGFAPQIGFFAFLAGSLAFAMLRKQSLPVVRRGFDHNRRRHRPLRAILPDPTGSAAAIADQRERVATIKR